MRDFFQAKVQGSRAFNHSLLAFKTRYNSFRTPKPLQTTGPFPKSTSFRAFRTYKIANLNNNPAGMVI